MLLYPFGLNQDLIGADTTDQLLMKLQSSFLEMVLHLNPATFGFIGGMEHCALSVICTLHMHHSTMSFFFLVVNLDGILV
jgi:hypothetical protein